MARTKNTSTSAPAVTVAAAAPAAGGKSVRKAKKKVSVSTTGASSKPSSKSSAMSGDVFAELCRARMLAALQHPRLRRSRVPQLLAETATVMDIVDEFAHFCDGCVAPPAKKKIGAGNGKKSVVKEECEAEVEESD